MTKSLVYMNGAEIIS